MRWWLGGCCCALLLLLLGGAEAMSGRLPRSPACLLAAALAD
jgi:hypothetical protein